MFKMIKTDYSIKLNGTNYDLHVTESVANDYFIIDIAKLIIGNERIIRENHTTFFTDLNCYVDQPNKQIRVYQN